MIAPKDSIAPDSTAPLPNSSRVYIGGTLHPEVRVPMREIALAATKTFSGELEANDPLPSVRQLAADLRLNHNTIVQAYRELERLDVVHMRRGQGTFVSEQNAPQAQRDQVLADVVDRALTDAHRHGIAPDELIDALGKATAQPIKGAKNA